jgi:hypothetical protein
MGGEILASRRKTAEKEKDVTGDAGLIIAVIPA